MGTFKDIMDTIGGLEGEVSQYIASSKQFKSLSKASMEGVLNFPVLVSNALSIEDASLVNKALERQFASFTLTVMSLNPHLNTMGGANANPADYIKKFHQNMDVRADGTDLLNTMNTFMQEASDRFNIDYEQLEGVSEKIIYHVFEGINYSKLNAENMKFNYSIADVTNDAVLNAMFNRRPIGTSRVGVLEADVNLNMNLNVDSGTIGDQIGREVGRVVGRTSGSRGSRGGTGYGRSLGLLDNDVKKANELVPTLISMRIYPVDQVTGTELAPIDFVLGVKATMHPISSEEMIVNIARGIKNENTFFNFIRWTTGEIKFFKDFVFTINELKLDAVNSSTKASRWWSMLKRRRALARIKNVILPQRLLPNATIVITQEECDVLKEQYGYDLHNSALIRKLMENYFLISFVIVDPVVQRAKFMFDGRNEFETLTFATLAREASTNDKQFKEMLSMLGRRI